MEIEDSFTVDLPVEEAWRVLLDIERIALCLPGAQLQEIAGEEYRGVVKVKVGPITAQYKGVARLEDVDDAAHTAVIVGNGRDTRGQGHASATIQLVLSEQDGGTRVEVVTDLSITGKVAQFGRGVMADVSAKLLAQFVQNLERDVLSAPEPEVDLATAEEAGAAPDGPPEPDPTGVASVAAGARPAAEPSGNGAAVRTVSQPEAVPVDLLEVSGTSLLKRVAPLVGALVVLLVVRRALRRRAARAHAIRAAAHRSL
jgi:carbon monoxide dehydrogenase subunit G